MGWVMSPYLAIARPSPGPVTKATELEPALNGHTRFLHDRKQKDIQQALLLRWMCSDLLTAHPQPRNLRRPAPRPTACLLITLTPAEREVAGVLYQSLVAGGQAWKDGGGREGAVAAA